MQPNTKIISDLYQKYSDKTAADGNPILTVLQNADGAIFVQQRMFDQGTGIEQGSLNHEVDMNALGLSASEAQADLDSIIALQAFVAAITPDIPIKVVPGPLPKPRPIDPTPIVPGPIDQPIVP